MSRKGIPPLLGALGGLVLWAVVRSAAGVLPSLLLFPLAFGVFVFGAGAIVLPVLAENTDPWDSLAVAFGIGFAVAPLTCDLLAKVHAQGVFAPLAFASAGSMAVIWRRASTRRSNSTSTAWPWYLALTIVFVAISALLAHVRLVTGPDRVAVFGGYDMSDLTYYSDLVAELSHTVPPTAPFLGGAPFIYSYYPHLLLAVTHVFTGIPALETTVRFGWPAFTLVAVWAAFAFFSRLMTRNAAAVAALLVFVGEGIAYIPALAMPRTVAYDTEIWSSLFMAPTATWIYFNTWTPTLAVLFALLYGLSRDTRVGRWTVVSAASIAILLMFKVFAYAILVPALFVAAAVVWLRGDRATAIRYAVVSGLAVLLSIPWLYWIGTNQTDTRTAVRFLWLDMPNRMLLKGSLLPRYAELVGALGSHDRAVFIAFTLVTVLFFIGGLGTRCLGVPAVLRGLIGSRRCLPMWTVLAWTVVLGVSLSSVWTINTHPDEIQPYQLGLFLLWPFTITAVMPRENTGRWRQWVAAALVVAASVPVTIHFFATEVAGRHEPPIAALDADELRLAAYLSTQDPETTVILYSDVEPPSLLSIVSGRRVALAWGTGQNDTARQRGSGIDRFFTRKKTAGQEELEQDLDLLKQLGVTHVIERPGTDSINPAVLSRLAPVFAAKTFRLWEVPRRLKRS